MGTQAAAIGGFHRRLVTPLRTWLAADGDPRPELRAELLAAAIVGILLARRTGGLEALAAADADDVAAAVAQLIGRR
jgi:hypothetical protein